MIVIEVIQYNNFTQPIVNDAPFCYYSQLSNYELADYWTDIFGAEEESNTELFFVNSFLVNSTDYYTKVNSYAEYLDQEKSFYWDNDSQILYFHIEHSLYAYSQVFEYSRGVGFTDKELIYVDGLDFKPLIKSIPSLSQQQDLQNYDKLSFVNGSIVLDNTNAVLDYFINSNVYGNEVRLYYLPDGKIDYTRSELVDLRAFYIEDYDFGLQQFTLRVQDVRKAGNIEIPTEIFLESDYPNIKDSYKNKTIPLMLGPCYISEAKPTNSETTGNVNFRQAISLTSLGTVQTFSDDVWTTRTPTSTNLSTGEFTLSYLHARKGGTTTGSVLKCRVLGSVGIDGTYASDYIKYVNQEYLGVEYLPSLYDETEWEAVETELSDVGLLIEKAKPLYDVIKDIQNGSNVGFRYDIKGDARRTLTLDDWTRTSSYYVAQHEIKNINILPVETNFELLSATTEVLYNHDYYDDEDLSVVNSDYASQVLTDYKQQPKQTLETALTNSTDATERAEWFAERYRYIPKIVTLELMGRRFLTVNIYDTMDVEITIGFIDRDDSNNNVIQREYFGVWKVQVLSVDPDTRNIGNKIKAVLIERI